VEEPQADFSQHADVGMTEARLSLEDWFAPRELTESQEVQLLQFQLLPLPVPREWLVPQV